jgi:DMSO/TMAO reductase YedYZ molybdopterin-dependent catalytic subunit
VGIISRGFHGRARESDHRLPPGQYETYDFPVLSAGPTPRIEREEWEFAIVSETGDKHAWNWTQLMALPSEHPTVDLHCVTKWSKFGTDWRGVSMDVLLNDVGSLRGTRSCR